MTLPSIDKVLKIHPNVTPHKKSELSIVRSDPGDEGECKCSEEGQGPNTAGLSDI